MNGCGCDSKVSGVGRDKGSIWIYPGGGNLPFL